MTKFDKEYLHNFGNTYHALASTEVPFSTKKQLVDDLWETIQAEFSTPATDGSEPSTQPGPPSGTTTFRIHNKDDGTVWSHKTFLTKQAAINQLVHHYSSTALEVTDNPLLTSYWRNKYEIREITV